MENNSELYEGHIQDYFNNPEWVTLHERQQILSVKILQRLDGDLKDAFKELCDLNGRLLNLERNIAYHLGIQKD